MYNEKFLSYCFIRKSLLYCIREGSMPEWLKGADCKSAAYRYVGSNPTRPNLCKFTNYLYIGMHIFFTLIFAPLLKFLQPYHTF